MTPIRVVLDTNCLVSALIFPHGTAGQLRAAWQRGAFVPLVCRESIAELFRVLGYPKFKLGREDIDRLLADILPWAEVVDGPLSQEPVEALRDKDDSLFIHLAQNSGAAFLVSGDTHILELHALFPALHIVSPAEFFERAGINRQPLLPVKGTPWTTGR